MEWWALAVILFGGMLVLMMLGMNIVYCLGLTAVIGIIMTFKSPGAGFIIVATEAYSRGTNFLILAVPMFVLLAEVIISGGVTQDTFHVFSRLLCRVPGALAIATTAMATLFAALVGSSLANAVIIGRVSISEMERRNYAKSLAAGVVMAGGTLGILIPPSTAMIFYSLFSEESLGKLFIAGVMPGLMISFMMMAYIVIRVKLNPEIAPPLPRVSFIEAVKTSYKLAPFLALISTMFFCFYFGVATPSEIGGVSAFVGFLLITVYGRLDWGKLKIAVKNAVRTSVMLMWILITAVAFGTVLAFGKVPQNLTQWVISLPVSPMMIMVVINVFLLLLGCILETGAITMVIWPLLIVVARALGWDLIWFAVILVIQIELGQITPPVGLILFGMNAIAPEIGVADLYRGVLPFVVILILAIVLIIAFPEIAVWLPSRM